MSFHTIRMQGCSAQNRLHKSSIPRKKSKIYQIPCNGPSQIAGRVGVQQALLHRLNTSFCVIVQIGACIYDGKTRHVLHLFWLCLFCYFSKKTKGLLLAILRLVLPPFSEPRTGHDLGVHQVRVFVSPPKTIFYSVTNLPATQRRHSQLHLQ